MNVFFLYSAIGTSTGALSGGVYCSSSGILVSDELRAPDEDVLGSRLAIVDSWNWLNLQKCCSIKQEAAVGGVDNGFNAFFFSEP